MINKYYIKEGFEEKGPLTVEELKKLGVQKTTLVRQQDSPQWFQSQDVPELQILFKRKRSVLKVIGIFLLVVIILGIFFIFFDNYNRPNPPYYSMVEDNYLPPPPPIHFQVSQHKKNLFRELFKDCNLSGEKKQLVTACDYTNSYLRNKALSIVSNSPGEFNLGQVCDIFDYCKNNWSYVNDPAVIEYVEYASTTLQNGLNGDCDDYAVLVCSMILAIGGEARINYAYDANAGHAFTEVNIGDTDIYSVQNYISKRYKMVYDYEGIKYRTDSNGNKWLNLDWFSEYPGGKYFNYSYGTTFYILQKFCENF